MNPNASWLFETITFCAPIILLFGIILGTIYYKRLENIHRTLFFYLLVALFIDILSRVMGHYFNNNLILIPIFGLLELVILATLYFKFLIKIKNKLWLFPIGCLILFNIIEIFTLVNVDPTEFYCNSRVLDSIAIVVMSIIFFFKILGSEHQQKPGFLFLNTIIFAFHSLNLILYLPINFLINVESDIKFHFWTTSVILTSVFYISIIRIIWIHGRNLKH